MSKTTTRADIAKRIQNSLGFPMTESSKLVDGVIQKMHDILKNDDEIKVVGLGNFKTRKKNERIGRNPKTKEEKVISSRKVVVFYPSRTLNKKINSTS